MSLYETEAWRQMMSGQPYDALNPSLVRELVRVRRLVRRYNDTDSGDTDTMDKIIRSVVTKDIPSGEVWAGNPAKCINKL